MRPPGPPSVSLPPQPLPSRLLFECEAAGSRRVGDAWGCRPMWKGSRRGQARGLHQIPGLPLQAQGEGSDLWGLGPAAPWQPRRGATSHFGEGVPGWFLILGVLTVLEVSGAIAGSVPAARPGPFIRVVVVVIGVVVGVLVRVVRVVSHHAVHAAGQPQVTECRALRGRGPVTRARGAGVAGPGRRVASLEPVAGGGPGAAAGGSRRGSGPRPRRRRAVVSEQQDRRARRRGGSVGGALGGGARVPSALRLVLRAQTQQAEHLPVVLPLDLLAPGARSRRGIARGLLLAGGRRGAAQDRAELQRPQQERGPGEAHLSLSAMSPTPEDAAQRKGKLDRNHAGEGEIFLRGGGGARVW